MSRIKNKTKIGYWDNDIVERTVEAVQNMNLIEPVLNRIFIYLLGFSKDIFLNIYIILFCAILNCVIKKKMIYLWLVIKLFLKYIIHVH